VLPSLFRLAWSTSLAGIPRSLYSSIFALASFGSATAYAFVPAFFHNRDAPRSRTDVAVVMLLFDCGRLPRSRAAALLGLVCTSHIELSTAVHGLDCSAPLR